MPTSAAQPIESHSGGDKEKDKTPVFDAAAIFQSGEKSAVKIMVPGTAASEHYGSGFFVSSGEPHSCEVATLSHVTGGSQDITAKTSDGEEWDGQLEKIDWKNQIAIYKLHDVIDPTHECQEAKVSTHEPKMQEMLVGVGADADLPEGQIARPFSVKVAGKNPRTDLNLTLLPNEDESRDLLVTSGAKGQRGFSGAAMYDASHEVVAMAAGPGPDNNTLVAEFGSHLQADLDEIKAERLKP